MKKYLLSLSLIVVFSFYALLENTRGGASGLLGQINSTSSKGSNQITPATNLGARDPVVSIPISRPKNEADFDDDDDDSDEGGSMPVTGSGATTASPQPISNPPVPPVGQAGAYKDGTYTGPVTDAYFGNIQVQAVISGGKISDVVFLQYPNDRATSIRINEEAIPRLKQEVIVAQSANVNIISGATQTSEAFNHSLASALAQAKI